MLGHRFTLVSSIHFTMPHEYYGYGSSRGGFSQYYTGKRGIKWHKKHHENVDASDTLEHKGGAVVDEHTGERKGVGQGAPAVGALVNEISIESGHNREAQRTIGKSTPDVGFQNLGVQRMPATSGLKVTMRQVKE